jgi:hypothetical protein
VTQGRDPRQPVRAVLAERFEPLASQGSVAKPAVAGR